MVSVNLCKKYLNMIDDLENTALLLIKSWTVW